MNVPSALNSKIYHGLNAMKTALPEFQRLGIDRPATRRNFIYELAEVSNDNSLNRVKDLVTKRGKFTSKGKDCIRRLLEYFKLGSTATWDDLYQKAIERKKYCTLNLK